MPKQEISSVERIINELKILQKWITVKKLSETVNSAPPTVMSDMVEMERLGLVVKRAGERAGTRGKIPTEFRLKDDEKDVYRKHNSFPVDYLLLIQVLNDDGRLGLTAEQISEIGDIPIAKTYRMVKTLQAIKWVYVSKKLTQTGKRVSVYKPRYRIMMLGE
ncbi:hypothetical protein KAR91_39600 [Candidatus Pacearchaeota archaeon]|nr:hypothetical protein [Candidatus Pacearchaeota archaeon]